ncbi:MAG: phosphodiester glycosidase family protein [Bacteroidales bacterium]
MVEGETFAAGGTFKMEVTSVSNSTGDSEIPEDGFVIHGYGTDTSGGGTIGAKTFVEGLSIGDIVTFNSVIKVDDVEVKPYQIISGNPRTMGDGEVLDTESERTDASSYHPRSGIGYGNDGKRVIMMVVDGRTSVSNGVRTSQLGEIMKYAGATDAINLDGGGSSTLYTLPLGIRNSPSDGNERAVGSAIFLVNGNEDDDVIASIGFEDWAKVFPKYGVYSPVIYGYNKYGMLIDTDVQGFELSCPEGLGRIEDGKFIGDGEGTYPLTAEYNGLEASIPVTVAVTEEISFRLTSVINDTYREYAVEVNALLDGEEASIDPSALTWSTGDVSIVSIDTDKGILKGIENGEAVVYGTVGDFTGELTVIVEKPESNVMAVDPDMDIDSWTVAQVGGSGITKVAYENGMKLTYTGASGRSNYIRLSKNNRLWSLPDAIRIRFNPGDAPITSLTLTTMDANNIGYTNAFDTEIVANEENIIDLATDDWCDSEDLQNFPLYLTQIQFGMGTSTTGEEYVVDVSGIELVYDSAPASVDGALVDGVSSAVIYPNPINVGGDVSITGLADGAVKVMIYSLSGELVRYSSVQCLGGFVSIPASELMAGVYFVKTVGEDGDSITKKLIIK